MRPAGKIALITLLSGLTWIWVSDALLYTFNDSPFSWVTPIKGSIFVVLVTLLIYFLTRRFNKDLNRSEKYFRELYLNNPEALLICNGKTLEILDVNPQVCELYGYEKDEMIGFSLNKLRGTATNEIHAGVEKHIGRNKKQLFIELKLQEQLSNDRDKRVLSLHNITDREELKNALLRRDYLADDETLDQELFLIRMNTDPEVLYANRAIESMTGGAVGRRLSDLITPEDRYKLEKTLEEVRSHP